MSELDTSGRRSIQVVLAEGEQPLRILLEKALPESGRLMVALKSGVEAQESPRQRSLDQTVLDLEIPELGRVERYSRQNDGEDGDSEVLIVTAHSELQSIAEALEPEAYDFLTKPLSAAELAKLVEEVEAAPPPTSNAISRLRQKMGQHSPRSPILADSPAMERLLRMVERVANSTATVLINGETGSGKGMIARLIHELSPRHEERFVAINCSAFQDHLLESELFGHEKGAFTGAVVAKPGLFEVADKGTLFLDEVAEMSSAMQAKLLQVLDSGELRRVGGTKLRRAETRIVAATNKDLKEEVKAGRFREDLLFRLTVVSLLVPSLRQRREEIPELVEGFMERFKSQGLPAKRFSRDAMALLQAHSWPGNVRELANTIEGLLLLTQDDVIRPDDLPQSIRPTSAATPGLTTPSAPAEPMEPTEAPVPLTEVEKVHVALVLRYTDGKKAPAARILGIDVKTL
ncbi:MAG: sigma-54-dependent Fis family transcriptional regulator, partial [Acidobacteria bacterium]|nr:sigma-54-dependent Fis family transcriptional regulator [Acidobacteriota bacterium]